MMSHRKGELRGSKDGRAENPYDQVYLVQTATAHEQERSLASRAERVHSDKVLHATAQPHNLRCAQ